MVPDDSVGLTAERPCLQVGWTRKHRGACRSSRQFFRISSDASRAPVDDVQEHMRAKVGELPARLAPPVDVLIPNIAGAALRHRGDLLARALARRAVDLRLAVLAGETPTLAEPVDDPLAGGEVVLERTDDGWRLDAAGARAFVREKIPEPASPDAVTVHDLPFVWEIPFEERPGVREEG